jgi:predicted phosphodiesterase
MRYLVLSDIHANLEALQAVLDAEPPGSFDEVLVLGDLVGYGADPNAVVEIVRALEPSVIVRGNHDKVAAGVDDPQSFNLMARTAALWTFEVLTPENRRYLAELPIGPAAVETEIEACHGAPYDEDAYVWDDLDALRALKLMEHRVCLFGHTHIPIVFSLDASGLDVVIPPSADTLVVGLDGPARLLINPGAVGQPRDGHPRAAYALLDIERNEIVLKRAEYAVAQAQAKILAAGLPAGLAERLALGR